MVHAAEIDGSPLAAVQLVGGLVVVVQAADADVDAARLDPTLSAFRDEPVVDASVSRLPLPAARPVARTPRLPIALIGASGRVGSDLLKLLSQPAIDAPVHLVGVANSRAALWQAEGLAPGLAA